MPFQVGLYCYRGVIPLPVSQTTRNYTDSVYVLEQPYLANLTAQSNGATAVSTEMSPNGTSVLRVEVADGSAIRYEIWPNGTGTAPSSTSPLLTGREQVHFPANSKFAFIEAT